MLQAVYGWQSTSHLMLLLRKYMPIPSPVCRSLTMSCILDHLKVAKAVATAERYEDDSAGHALRSHLKLAFWAGEHPGLLLSLHTAATFSLHQTGCMVSELPRMRCQRDISYRM